MAWREVFNVELDQPTILKLSGNEAKAGSILVWHGNAWHGACPRKKPGLRLGIIYYFGRFFMGQNPMLANGIAPEEIAHRPRRLAQLIGADQRLVEAAERGVRDELARQPAAIFGEYG